MSVTVEMKQLKKETIFRRTEGDTVLTRTLPPGKRYGYSCVETATDVTHVAIYTDEEGKEWVNSVKVLKQVHTGCDFCNPSPCTCLSRKPHKPAPSNPIPARLGKPVEPPSAALTAASAQTSTEVVARIAPALKQAEVTEEHVRRTARTVEMLRGDVYQVNYYIPSCLESVPNPSRIFRKHGFRLDGSNWVFPAKGLEHCDVQEVLHSWDDMKPVEKDLDGGLEGFTSKARVRYWVVKYTPEQLAQMKDLAQSQLADELQKTHRSLINRIDDAAKALQDAQDALSDDATPNDRSKLENTYVSSLRATLNEACERFEMCLKGAEIFDDTGSMESLFDAVKNVIRVRGLLVNEVLRKSNRKPVKIPASIGS